MFKEMIDSIRRKIKEKNALTHESIREYLVDYLYLGCYDKKVYEDKQNLTN